MNATPLPVTGHHMVIDGHVRDGAVLNDPDALCSMFDHLVETLGMEYLQRPSAYRVPIDPDKRDSEEDEGGWSVICQITTSHIAIHGWPLRCAFMMDIFSCRDFDRDVALQIVLDRLGVERFNRQDVRRGS